MCKSLHTILISHGKTGANMVRLLQRSGANESFLTSARYWLEVVIEVQERYFANAADEITTGLVDIDAAAKMAQDNLLRLLRDMSDPIHQLLQMDFARGSEVARM
jgi:hypothetical protein